MGLAQNIGYILIGFIALVSIFLIILTLLEKKLKIKFLSGRLTRNEIYIKKLAKINISTPKESIKVLDKMAKAFFKEAFHLPGAVDNSELEKFFRMRNNKKATDFASQMTRFLYAGEEITEGKIRSLAILLAEIISSNRILTKEEKEELDKKSRERDPNQQKPKIPFLGKFMKKDIKAN